MNIFVISKQSARNKKYTFKLIRKKQRNNKASITGQTNMTITREHSFKIKRYINFKRSKLMLHKNVLTFTINDQNRMLQFAFPIIFIHTE